MTDLTTATATELSRLYRSGTASPVAVAQQVLDKITRVDPVLNAFCFTDPESTLAQAQASEQRWRQGQPLSAMDGVPFAVKDLILTRGCPTLQGSRAIDPDQSWSEDAPVVANLRSSGAVLVGKTTTSEFGVKMTTDSLLHGITRNPWNTMYSPGGSSGGSAVAVAASMVPIALGTDYFGSVTNPAAFCGIVGFKPTYGTIPHNSTSLFEFNRIGVFARSVKDTSTVFDIKQCDIDLSQIKIAYCTDLGFGMPVDPEIVEKVEQVATVLQKLGAKVQCISKVSENPTKVIQQMFAHDLLKQWSKLSKKQQKNTGKLYQFYVYNALILPDTSTVDDLKVQQIKLKNSMTEFMKSFDLILSASTAITADVLLADNTSFTFDGNLIPFGYLYNLSHQPAVSMPVGLNTNCMPIGIQLGGAVGRDDLVLAVASVIEQQFSMPACPVIP